MEVSNENVLTSCGLSPDKSKVLWFSVRPKAGGKLRYVKYMAIVSDPLGLDSDWVCSNE